MKRLTLKEKQEMHQKFGGRCAYCGYEITLKAMVVDHIVPIRRNPNTGGCERPELDCIENMNPACRSCNHDKGRMTLDVWRGWIKKHQESLQRHDRMFQFCVRYKLVQANDVPVFFYFEKLKNIAEVWAKE